MLQVYSYKRTGLLRKENLSSHV